MISSTTTEETVGFRGDCLNPCIGIINPLNGYLNPFNGIINPLEKYLNPSYEILNHKERYLNSESFPVECKSLCVKFQIVSLSYFWVTEVRSKILTPLETTGGNSFSLEGVWKNAFYNSKLFAGWFTFPWRDSDVLPGGLLFHWRDSVILPRGL